MPLDFPNAPTTGQTYTGPNNVMWQWDGSKWVAGYGATSAYAPINSPQGYVFGSIYSLSADL